MEGTKQSSSRNLQKFSDGDKNTPLIDRLSELPDSVLCHILSFLPTKLSTATCILARKWRFLWIGVPNFDFKFLSKPKHETTNSDIIYRVMMLNTVQNLNNFRLYCKYGYNEYHLETWISSAILRNVRKLDLGLPLPRVMLPRCLFTCKTLVDLTLVCCVGIPFPDTVCFPSLKKLNLYYVKYKVDESLPHLVSGCPVLEELLIHGVVPLDLVHLNISSPTIKWLMIKFHLKGIQSSSPNYRVEINAPALEYLNFEDVLSNHISARMLTSLIEADIFLKNQKQKENEDVNSNSVLEFVDILCKVKRLKLSICYTKLNDLAFSASTMRFPNLTKLELSADWRFISKFLENSDNLQVLIMSEVEEELKCWREPQQVPICLLLHLTTIRIDQFGFTEHEFEMVRYLLWNAQVLKTMEIYTKSGLHYEEKKFSALQRISLFRRGSTACELAFY